MVAEVSSGLEVSVLLSVLDEGDAAARLKLAEQALEILINPEADPVEREQIVPVLLKLASDESADIRLLLNEKLVGLSDLNPDILFALIADDDVIALPFLATTPSLKPPHMLAILRVGDEARQKTVVRRADISKEAAAYVMKAGAVHVVAELLRNPKVSFTADNLRTLYSRFQQAALVQDVITQRVDCPPDLRILQAKRTAGRMRQLMAERGWTGMGDSLEFVSDAEENTVLTIIAESEDKDMRQTLEFLVSKNLLTPSLIVRASCLGEIRVVESVLQHLSGYAVERTRDLMFARGASGLKSLISKAGIPAHCLGVLAAACDVAADAGNEGYQVTQEAFGRRVLEALMTRYEFLSPQDRSKQIDFIGRYAHERVRKIARRLRTDMQRAA